MSIGCSPCSAFFLGIYAFLRFLGIYAFLRFPGISGLRNAAFGLLVSFRDGALDRVRAATDPTLWLVLFFLPIPFPPPPCERTDPAMGICRLPLVECEAIVAILKLETLGVFVCAKAEPAILKFLRLDK